MRIIECEKTQYLLIFDMTFKSSPTLVRIIGD